jgi:pimeloyl-ACP methyl ester carboxylesterase
MDSACGLCFLETYTETDISLQIGLWPYCSFISDIIRDDPDVGIIILEFMPISMHITSPPLGREALCSALDIVLAANNVKSFVLVAHSFGTVISTYILRSPSLSPRVAGTVLIDPIPFLLSYPDVASNFVYRTPREANEWQLWYFASRDPDISRTLARHFFWSESIMFRSGQFDPFSRLARTTECVHRTGGPQNNSRPLWRRPDRARRRGPALPHT